MQYIRQLVLSPTGDIELGHGSCFAPTDKSFFAAGRNQSHIGQRSRFSWASASWPASRALGRKPTKLWDAWFNDPIHMGRVEGRGGHSRWSVAALDGHFINQHSSLHLSCSSYGGPGIQAVAQHAAIRLTVYIWRANIGRLCVCWKLISRGYNARLRGPALAEVSANGRIHHPFRCTNGAGH